MEKNNNKPKLRFPGFTDPWEQRKLGEVGNTFTGLSGKTKEDFGHGDAKFVTYVNVFGNVISDPNDVQSVEIDDKQNQVKYGDVFFTTSSETPEEVGMSSVWLENTENVYLNSFCFGYRPTVEFDLYYLAFMLRSPEIRKKFMFLAQGISRYNISKNKVMEMNVPVPELNEQRKVGTFFRNLDNIITLHQRKLNHLQDKKKGLLQKMFPKNGERFPELRFPGFTEAWEQRKLKQLANFAKGRGYSKNDLTDVGTPIILYGRLYTKYQSTISEVDTFVVPKSGSVYSTGEEVIVPASGETAEDIARASAVVKSDFLLGGDLNIIYPNKDISTVFLALSISNGKQQKELSKRAQGKSVVHLRNSDLEEVTISFPCRDEQERIGSLFEYLDNLITLHQRKLEHLQQQKKGLLQQMFI